MSKIPITLKEFKEEKRLNANIDRELAVQRANLSKEVTILLLGPGESGKSTVAKQFNLLAREEETDVEVRIGFRERVIGNIFGAMRTVVDALDDYDLVLEGEGLVLAERLMEMEEGEVEGLNEIVRGLLELEVVQEVIRKGAEYMLMDSAGYFFSEIDRICEPDYVPNDQDILRVRERTIGVVETKFEYGNMDWTLVDVAGQKNNRKKWIHLFEDVDTVLFCASIGDYDMVMREDMETNRMTDTLELFSEIINGEWFKGTDIILFLNKVDIFMEKFPNSPLSVAFPDYDDTNEDPEFAIDFIIKKFLSSDENSERLIFPHRTCATSTETMKTVFDSVSVMFLHKIVDSGGIF